MFDTFWGEFWWNLFIICFLPYLVYFIVAFMYLVMMLYEPTEEALEWQFLADDLKYLETHEPPLRILFMLLLTYQLAIEVK